MRCECNKGELVPIRRNHPNYHKFSKRCCECGTFYTQWEVLTLRRKRSAEGQERHKQEQKQEDHYKQLRRVELLMRCGLDEYQAEELLVLLREQ